MNERILGCYEGADRGALILIFGATHGNESAGVEAIREIFRLLEQEPAHNPSFRFAGKLLGIVGNKQARMLQKRFLNRDLNRMWTQTELHRVEQIPAGERRDEDRELAEILAIIHQELRAYQPEALVLLDLHTTSAQGGIFCIPTDDAPSLRLAKSLHAPVILGMLDGIEGTLLHFVAGNLFALNGFPKFAVGVAFESGQHDDPLSVNRAIAAIVHLLRAAGCIREEDVDTRHEAILSAYARDLPKVTRLRYVHHLREGDGFRMHPGYENFSKVAKGEHLADDVTGAVRAPEDGLLLMPLYQAQGSDGFFLVEPLE
jgi:succinylglutamate desuccinylase